MHFIENYETGEAKPDAFKRWFCSAQVDAVSFSSLLFPLSHFPGVKIDVMPFHCGDPN